MYLEYDRSTRLRVCGLMMLFICITAKGQQIIGEISAPSVNALVLLEVIGGNTHPLDSTTIAADGSFFTELDLPQRGFYRIAANDTDQVDLILTPDEQIVRVSFTGTPLQENIHIELSAENERLWRYKAQSREAQAKLVAISEEKDNWSRTDTAAHARLDSLARVVLAEKENSLTAIAKEAPLSYFSKVINASQQLNAASGNGPAILRAVDLSDPELLRSSLFLQVINKYVQATPVLMEEQLMDLADTLIARATGNEECKAYMVNAMLDLFAMHGPEIVLQHVVDHHVSDTTEVPQGLRAKVHELQKARIGAVVSSVTLPALGGKVALDSVFASQPVTLLFFYSSTCEHCHEQIPGIRQLQKEFGPRGLGIIGIALDTDTTLFHRTIAEQDVSWPCYSEFNAWGSEAAKAFQVKATPALVIVDRQGRIASKPVNWQRAGEYFLEHLPDADR